MFNPEGPSKKQEAGQARPTPADIAEAVENQKMNREMSRMQYEGTKNEFMNWAEGETDEVRDEYYPGWADEDFATLLEALKKMEKGG